MYRNSPKLIMRVDLSGEKDLKIVLILLDKYFNEHHTSTNLFLSNDGFTIYRGNLMTIFQTGSIHLPKNFLIGQSNTYICKETFTTEQKRYEYLKRLQRALLEWSNSQFWFGFTSDDKVKLTFRDKVWLLF
jgi:hypothetical protein